MVLYFIMELEEHNFIRPSCGITTAVRTTPSREWINKIQLSKNFRNRIPERNNNLNLGYC